MADGSPNLRPDGNISDALTSLQGGDWTKLVTFFDAAVTLHPSTDARLREQLQLPQDETLEDDMLQVVALYADLAKTGTTFQQDIRSQMLELLDDIFHQNISTQTRYEHLQTLVENFEIYEDDDPTKIVTASFQEKWEELKIIWAEGKPVDDAVLVRRRIVRMLTQLAEDANTRAESATALCTALGTLKDDMSRLEDAFQMQAKIFSDKVGKEAAEIAALRAEAIALRMTIDALQSKVDVALEKQKHPPWYYFIPVVGVGIMIADLVKMTEDVKNSLTRMEETGRKLLSKKSQKSAVEHMNSMHLGVSDDLVSTSSDLHELIPVVRKLELGWRAIGADLREIVRLLGDGEGGMVKSEAFDAFDLEMNLIDAKKEWEAVAEKADNFRRFGTSAKHAASVDDIPWGDGT